LASLSRFTATEQTCSAHKMQESRSACCKSDCCWVSQGLHCI
jgi:hypothetical protein